MMLRKAPIILTSDFGLGDEYVGILKGVILSIDSHATIIDLTHSIKPQDIHGAARIIGRSYRYFPDGSIHLCIVDPGVGTNRNILAIRACNQYFVGPDNGIFTPILASGKCDAIHEVTNTGWFLADISRTFHGRDIMAPTVARLSLGESIESAGPRITLGICVTIDDTQPAVTPEGLIGAIDSIDRFGNLVSNISRDALYAYGNPTTCDVILDNRVMAFSRRSYADLPNDTPAALVNSSGFVEICIKSGNAARLLDAEIGDQVVIRTTCGNQ